MPPGGYKKPPITEAVIEFSFANRISDVSMSKFVREAKRAYPNAEETYEVNVNLEVGATGRAPSTTATNKRVGYKLTGQDQTEVIFLSAERLATIRLAPYCGWELLLETAKSNFAILKKISGYRQIARMATRYVNRIDIPRNGRKTIDLNEYVLVEPRTPALIPTLHTFSVQFTGSIPESGYNVIVNTGTVASPLIDHVAVLLDIDLYKDQSLPQKDADVWDLVNDFRRQKDEIFEAFVTDRARELFDAA